MPSSSQSGYFRWPTVHGDRVVFVSEDDLWEVPLEGGVARRLTSGLGEAKYPTFSPDGARIAYCGTEEGSPEVFVMDARGGPGRQLTFYGTQCAVVGWSKDGSKIRFRTNQGQYSPRIQTIFEVPPDGGAATDTGLGKAHWLSEQPDGDDRVLGRHADDLARWKRYRGGTAGALWIQRDGEWHRLLDELDSGIVRPMWLGERIYFLNDEHGYGNLYSCAPTGEDLQRHTDHHGFYARFAQTDGETIVYTVGGDLWRFDPSSGENEPIEVDYASPRTQLNRKFVDADEYLEEYTLHPKGHSLAVTARGKPFNFGHWEGAVRQTGEPQGVRYRLPVYTQDGSKLILVSDEGGEEYLEMHACDGSSAPEKIELEDIGRPLDMKLSPDGEQLAFTNHRHELIVVDLEDAEKRVVDRGPCLGIAGFDWSPDSRWIAYSIYDTWKTAFLRIVDTESWTVRDVTEAGYRDMRPCFDPDGRYLYFVSARWFDPVYDSIFFEISFPKSMRPCVLTLREDLESLFLEKPRPLDGSDDEDEDDDKDGEGEEGDEIETDEDRGADKETTAKKGSDGDDADDDDSDDETPEPVEIDFDGIEQRVEPFPVPVGYYGTLQATSDRVFWVRYVGKENEYQSSNGAHLQYYDLEKRKKNTFVRDVFDFEIGADQKTLVYEGSGGLRVVSASGSGPDDDSSKPNRESGWIDLSGRLAVSVEPRKEWRQMLRDSWRLMRDHYWNEDLAGVDWEEVWERYSPQVERCASRSEFSDLVWTMQGELGTSHAYEFGGDYREPPVYSPGKLAADISWDPDAQAYRIDHIVQGSNWHRNEASPLTAPGVNVEEGEHIVAINGRRLDESTSVDEALVHLAKKEVELTIRGDDGETRTRTVKTLSWEFKARYREWVDRNREKVHEASDGRLGYVHVPDMSAEGFAEFHRGFLPELRREGLVVDVRFNGGGHVSQLILEKLARERIGYDVGRWTQPLPYPEESIDGPLVAVTDENAGSDGDIFSHCFKLMELGPLVGKRTWGGVVGIWPRHRLVDGSVTTQPEFAFWFDDVGFGVENHGTAPDHDVELPPEAVANGEDPQLEYAIELAMKDLRKNPRKLPEFGPSPNLIPPPEKH